MDWIQCCLSGVDGVEAFDPRQGCKELQNGDIYTTLMMVKVQYICKKVKDEFQQCHGRRSFAAPRSATASFVANKLIGYKL